MAAKIGITSRKNMWRFEKEDFIDIVKKSFSLKEVLLNMNLRAVGGNYKTIHKYINELKLNTSHFITNKERCISMGVFNKKPIEFYLIQDNKTSSSSLKERLFKEGLLKNICCECGQCDVWCGKKISLILDHKNGNHYDWRLENLRILCPNCNATLETHCRGHKYISNKKIRDSVKKENTKKHNISRRKTERPTLEQLKKDVSVFGYVATGKKYNTSNTTIKKWIKFYEKNNY